MQRLSTFKFSYTRAFRLSLLLNVLLIVASIVLIFQTPTSAVTLRTIGSTDTTTSYSLDVDVNEIVYVNCVGAYGGEAQLGYLRNAQALTCPS